MVFGFGSLGLGVRLEMGNVEEEQTAFEIGVVVPRRVLEKGDECCGCVEVLVDEFRKVGLVVDRVLGIQEEFIKVQSCILLHILLPILLFVLGFIVGLICSILMLKSTHFTVLCCCSTVCSMFFYQLG